MEEPVCPECVVFEPQAWRKSLCRNCFKTFEQHQAMLEAAAASGQIPTSGEPKSAAGASSKEVKDSAAPKSTEKPAVSSSSTSAQSSSPSSATKQSSPSPASKTGSSSKPSTTTTAPSSPSTTSTKSTTATTTTTTTTPSSKSSFTSSKASRFEDKSKEKDDKSKEKDDKSKDDNKTKEESKSKSLAGKWGGTNKEPIGKSTGNGGTSAAGKPGTDKKVSLVSALAGKIDLSAKRGTPGSKDKPSYSEPGKCYADLKKSPAVGEKKFGSLGKAGKDTATPASPTSTVPASPSGRKLSPLDSLPKGSESKGDNASATNDNSARAKWEKRVSGGGGGGTGGGGGGKTDVSKVQKGNEGKAAIGADTTGNNAASPSPGKDKAGVPSKTASKDVAAPAAAAAEQTDSATTTNTTTPTTTGKKFPWEKSSPSAEKEKGGSKTASPPGKSTPKSPKSGRLSLKTAASNTGGTPPSSPSPKSPTPLSPGLKSPTPSSPLSKKDGGSVSPTSPKTGSPASKEASPASPGVDSTVKKDDTDSSKPWKEVGHKKDQKEAVAEDKSSKKDQEPAVKESPEKSKETTPAKDAKKDDAAASDSAAKALAEKEKALKDLQSKHLSLKIELEAREEVLKDELTAKQQALDELRQKQAEQEEELSRVKEQLRTMEEECQTLRKDADGAKQAAAVQEQREEWQKTLSDLRTQVIAMEEQCSRLEGDNQSLLSKLRGQEQRASQVAREDREGNGDVSGLQGELRGAEIEVEDLKNENEELRQELLDLRREMDEMYDTFRENELDEFRELQRELDLTAKNCRILQFKLRKSERRLEQVEKDRQHYEEKLRSLQSQFESGDARDHIEALEEELRTAKEVSVRLHDELDIVEDRRNKALEENRHLTELLEQTDKKQFRLEMEIDKLRDQVADLKQQLRERSPSRKEGTPDRREVLGRQGSQEYDSAQLMRDLCDSVERENDLKEQLKFVEEESRMMRRKLAEMEDENEALRVQLKKLSLKASRWREESEGRGHSQERKQGQTKDDSEGQGQRERLDSSDDETSMVTLKLQMALLEQELMTAKRTQAESEKEAERLREEVTSLHDQLREKEHEAMLRKEQEAPPTPNEYYEEKVRELTAQADELRWRIIEKDREIERLSTASMAHARHTHHGHHGHGARGEVSRQGKLKKSKSLDSDPLVEDLRRQLEAAQHEISSLRHQLTMGREQREEAEKETIRLRLQLQEQQQQLEQQANQLKEQRAHRLKEQPSGEAITVSPTAPLSVPSVHADDAAIENIELREKVKRGEEEVRTLKEQVRLLTDKLHALSRASSPRLGAGASAAHTSSPTISPLASPSSSSETAPTDSTGPPGSLPRAAAEGSGAREGPCVAPASTTPTLASPSPTPLSSTDGAEAESSIPHVPKSTHDVHERLREAEEEKRALARKMAELEEANCRLQSLVEGQKTTGTGAAGGKGTTEKEKKMERRVVEVGGGESREALMDKILDLEDEMNDLLAKVKKRDEEIQSQSREMTSLREKLQDAQDVGRRTELQLLKELDMLHDKNTVLSNLLDIVQERCNDAEAELEKYVQEYSAPSTRSPSAVSQVSALSDASCGSDEVFLHPPGGVMGDKGQVIHRDWEAKLKNRIESLERLLAEERQKVSMAEKKLHVSGEQTVAPSVSDDVKLRLREKELLQEELSESQHHLRLATDQVRGMRERLNALEEEHHRLRVDYGKLVAELDRREHDPDRDPWESDHTTSDSDKTPENSVEPESELVSLRAASLQQSAASPTAKPTTTKDTDPRTQTHPQNTQGVATDDVRALQHEVARYKLKAEQLEYKVEEISDIWRSKSAATEKEKQGLELQLKEKSHEIAQLGETVQRLQQELKTKQSELSKMAALKEELANEVTRREAAETELHVLVTQTADREQILRELRETVRTRDERLKEKDDIIHYLNECLEQRQRETEKITQKMAELAAQRDSGDSDKGVGGETDLEKENARLRETTRALREELAQGDANRQEIEKSRHSLEAASLGWEKQRAELQASLNIAEEKIRLYETLSSTSTDQAVEGIKRESMKYFEEKESLKSQMTTLRHQLVAFEKTARETTLRLQQDLNHKLQQLKEEAETNQKLMVEVQRLRAQNERAYRVQQEERLLRAEHQAMKVRYETRQEKLSQEYSKLLVTVDRLQKERQADRELVAGVQKAMALIRDAHAQDQMRWEEEKARLDNQIKEVAETQKLVQEMRQKTAQLKEQLGEQERSRMDVMNKFTTERAAWEIDRSNLRSKINQLEEQLHRTKKDHGSTAALETAWAKERAQQQSLLKEAHDLALDLQKQLQTRDQEAAHQQRQLVERFEAERQEWERERQAQNKLLTEMEGRVRRLGALQKHVLEVQERADRQVQQACRERAEVTRRLAETRQQQARDARAVDDIMTGLVRLRELGAMVVAEDAQAKQTSSDSTTSDLNKNIIKYIREALVQINSAADELSRRSKQGNGHIRRSLSSSELELLREELEELYQEGGDVFPAHDVTAPPVTSAQRGQSQLQKSVSLDSHAAPSEVTLPSLLRPLSASRTRTRTPVYASGSRSAQSSRATSPDVGHMIAPDFSPSTKASSNLLPPLTPEPETSLRQTSTSREGSASRQISPGRSSGADTGVTTSTGSLDRQKRLSVERTLAFTAGPSTSSTAGTADSAQKRVTQRPRTLTKSLSVDSSPWTPASQGPVVTGRSVSATTTPTQPQPPSTMTSTSAGNLTTSRRFIGGLSPRSARRKFFEEQPANQSGFLSWPERGRSQSAGSRGLQVPGHVDPGEVRRVAEEEHEWLLSRVVDVPPFQGPAMRTSISLDEKMHHRVVASVPQSGEASSLIPHASSPSTTDKDTHKVPLPWETSTSTSTAQVQSQPSAKDKRKMWKKSSSLDSSVGTCLARVGMQTVVPAVPAAFPPPSGSDLLAAVKSKLAPVFGRKTSKDEHGQGQGSQAPPRPPSPLFIQTSVPDIPLRPSSAAPTSSSPITIPGAGESGLEATSRDPSSDQESRGRGGARRSDAKRESHGASRDTKWRSQSADRATRPLLVHTDVIRPAQVWQFSETPV